MTPVSRLLRKNLKKQAASRLDNPKSRLNSSFQNNLIHSRLRHCCRIDGSIKFFATNQAKLNARVAECTARLVGVLGDFSRVVVADMRVQCRNEHERIFHVIVNFLTVRLNAFCAVLLEHDARVGEQANTLVEIIDNKRLEDVQLEIARCAADVDCHVVAHHLRCHHCHCLALRGIDFAGHDG